MASNLLAFFGINFVDPIFHIALQMALLLAAMTLVFLFIIIVIGWLEGFFQSFIGYRSGAQTSGADDMLSRLIDNQILQNIFFALIGVAIFLLIISTLIRIIKSELNFEKEGNSKREIYKKALMSMALFIVVPVTCIFGIFISNIFLGAIYKVLIAGVAETNVMLDIGGYSKYFGDNAEAIAQVESYTNSLLSGDKKPLTNMLWEVYGEFMSNGWVIAASVVTVGLFPMALAVIMFSPVLKILFSACIGAIQRIYEIAFLFLISPPVVGVMPLDDGASFKNWKKEFYSRVVSMYGLVVSVNLMIILIGVIIGYDKGGSIFAAEGMPSDASLTKIIFKYCVILAGILSIRGMSKTVSGIIGARDALESGSELTKAMMAETKGAFGAAAGVKKWGQSQVQSIKEGSQRMKDFRQRNASELNKKLGKGALDRGKGKEAADALQNSAAKGKTSKQLGEDAKKYDDLMNQAKNEKDPNKKKALEDEANKLKESKLAHDAISGDSDLTKQYDEASNAVAALDGREGQGRIGKFFTRLGRNISLEFSKAIGTTGRHARKAEANSAKNYGKNRSKAENEALAALGCGLASEDLQKAVGNESAEELAKASSGLATATKNREEAENNEDLRKNKRSKAYKQAKQKLDEAIVAERQAETAVTAAETSFRQIVADNSNANSEQIDNYVNAVKTSGAQGESKDQRTKSLAGVRTNILTSGSKAGVSEDARSELYAAFASGDTADAADAWTSYVSNHLETDTKKSGINKKGGMNKIISERLNYDQNSQQYYIKDGEHQFEVGKNLNTHLNSFREAGVGASVEHVIGQASVYGGRAESWAQEEASKHYSSKEHRQYFTDAVARDKTTANYKKSESVITKYLTSELAEKCVTRNSNGDISGYNIEALGDLLDGEKINNRQFNVITDAIDSAITQNKKIEDATSTMKNIIGIKEPRIFRKSLTDRGMILSFRNIQEVLDDNIIAQTKTTRDEYGNEIKTTLTQSIAKAEDETRSAYRFEYRNMMAQRDKTAQSLVNYASLKSREEAYNNASSSERERLGLKPVTKLEIGEAYNSLYQASAEFHERADRVKFMAPGMIGIRPGTAIANFSRLGQSFIKMPVSVFGGAQVFEDITKFSKQVEQWDYNSQTKDLEYKIREKMISKTNQAYFLEQEYAYAQEGLKRYKEELGDRTRNKHLVEQNARMVEYLANLDRMTRERYEREKSERENNK